MLSWLVFASIATIGAISSNEQSIKVTDHRPVLKVVEQLRERYGERFGWLVTYEDDKLSPYEQYSLEFVYQTQDVGADPSKVLTDLVNAHARLGHGLFKLEKSNSRWHIVPKYGSILDIKISISNQTMSLKDAVEIICSTVQRQSGKRIIMGRFDVINPPKSVQVYGKTESARAVLTRALDGTSFVWNLIYSDDLDGYILVVSRRTYR